MKYTPSENGLLSQKNEEKYIGSIILWPPLHRMKKVYYLDKFTKKFDYPLLEMKQSILAC